MTGEQFIEFAGKIAATYSDPASCRTAIGRAYYGAFHLAKAFLAEIGVRPPKNANAHVFIRQRFSNCGDAEGQSVGALLWDLYADRLKADYDLDDAHVETVTRARTCVETARALQSALTSCQSSASRARIKAGIDEYEKRISSGGFGSTGRGMSRAPELTYCTGTDLGGTIPSGRVLRGSDTGERFVVTAYEIRGKALKAYRRRQRRKQR